MKRYEKSEKFLKRAEAVIPLGSQTFSKSKTQYPVGVSPLFINKAKGVNVWDIDGNRYIDLVNSLAAVTLGYRNQKVDEAVRKQLKSGVIFSLPGKLEAEVAELIVSSVPSAEMVRFAKNGSDATGAAIRLSRAVTGRDEIAFCGYHGWQDWYIGSTSMNKGVPKSVSKMSHKFEYNKIETLREIFQQKQGKIAAVILEPMTNHFPTNNFLSEVKNLTKANGAILIFDETVTGFRFAKGGAQEEFGVTPDLTTLGKGIANGFPLSALVGNSEIMNEIKNVFFSGTFGGELLSLAAAKVVLEFHNKYQITNRLAFVGTEIATHVESEVISNGLQELIGISGHPTWKFLNWFDTPIVDVNYVKTFFLQEMFKRGVLVLGTHNVSWAMKSRDINKIKNTYSEVFEEISKKISNGTLHKSLLCDPILPLFRVR